jgi:Chitobiase/beta-hexosaminidase C-terminal domain
MLPLFLPRFRANIYRSSRLPIGGPLVTLALGVLLVGMGAFLNGCGGSSGGGSNPPPPSVAATPAFSPAGGTYAAAQTVTISDSTAGAAIYYTTDGSTPTTGSTKYTGAITVSATETIEAIATASGFTNSAVATASYTINIPTAETPTFSPAAGTYTGAQSVTISDATTGAAIYYTTDGSTPTASSTKYAGALTVSSTETISAIAGASGYTNSAVASAAYTINLPIVATPTFTPAAGSYTGAQSVTISDATAGAAIYYTTNGSTPTASSTRYSGAITVSATETIEAVATAGGYTNSAVAIAAYTISAPPNPQTIDTNIITSYSFTVASGPGAPVTYGYLSFTQYGIAPGAPSGTAPSQLAFEQVTNSNNNQYSYVQTFVGGPSISESLYGSVNPVYWLDQGPTTLLDSATRTTTGAAGSSTVQSAPQLVNSVTLPFTGGSAMTGFLANSGSGIFAGASNSPDAYFVPVASGTASLGAPVKLQPTTPVSASVSAIWADFGNHAEVVSGTGATAILNLYDSNGAALLSAPGGMISPNGATGYNVTPIAAGASTAVNVPADYSGPSFLLLYSQAVTSGGINVGFSFVQAGVNGASPSVTTGTVPNPNGGPFGLVEAFVVDAPLSASGIPQALYFVDQAAGSGGTGLTLWKFNVAATAGPSNATTLQFTLAGSSTIQGGGTTGALGLINDNNALFVAAPTGVYMVPKLSGGSNDLNGAILIDQVSNIVGLQSDQSGNILVLNKTGYVGISAGGDSWFAANGGSAAVANPSVGTSQY